MDRFHLISIVIICIFIFLGCNDEHFPDPKYPTIINALSTKQVDNIDASLRETPVYNCTAFDQFGFCVFNLNDTELCEIHDSTEANFTSAELLQLAKEAAFEYANYLGNVDTSVLTLEKITSPLGKTYSNFKTSYPDSSPFYWSVMFKAQYIEGLQVIGSNITLICAETGVVAMNGHQYDPIYIPLKDAYDEETAKAQVYGQLLIYDSKKFTPTEDNYWYPSRKMILPLKRSDQIEMRIVWALYPENWEVFLDSQSGEILLSTKLN